MKIDAEDHGGVAVTLDKLALVYALPTREAALKRAVEIALKLSEHADSLGCIHLLDCRRPGPMRTIVFH